MMKGTKKKDKLVIQHRDLQVVGMIGKCRTFEDRKRRLKSDATGRKAKHKERY